MSREEHFYLSSLPPRPRRITQAAREHWAVENGLHWVLDVQLGEDRSAVHEAPAANLAVLRRIALMLARRDTTFRRGKRIEGVAAKLAKAARNTQYLEHLLSLGVTQDQVRPPWRARCG